MNQTCPSPAVPVCVSPKGAGLRWGEDRCLQKRGRGSVPQGWDLLFSGSVVSNSATPRIAAYQGALSFTISQS